MREWIAWIAAFLGANGHYKPSAYALASDPIMMMLFVSAWLASAAACVAIGGTLMWRRASHITLSANAARVFGLMFVLIGFDFAMSATTVFVAVYRLKVVVLVLTAAVTATVVVLTVSQVFGATRGDKDE